MVIVKEFRANDRTANQQQYNARPETAAERGMLLVVEAVSWVAGRVDKNRRALIGATYRDVLRRELPAIRFTCASDYPFHLCGLSDVISA